MNDCGVVYVATKDDIFLEEAFLSADTVKRVCPDLPITVFTDRPQHPLCSLGRFDKVEPTESASEFRTRWTAGQIDRIQSLLRTPYMRTLHIDTDTRVVSREFPRIFHYLEEFDVGMVETSWDDSYSRYHYGKPMFNGGLVLYRRNEKTWAWLEEWLASSARNFRMAPKSPLPPVSELEHIADENIRRKLLVMDQLSLAQILSPQVNRFDLKLKILDYSWNYRGSSLPEKNRHPARILHLPRAATKPYRVEIEKEVRRIMEKSHSRESGASA